MYRNAVSFLAILLVILGLTQCATSKFISPAASNGPRTHASIRVTADGTFQIFPIPNFCVFSTGQIAVGPDENIWFANGCDAVDRITPNGVITVYPIPTLNSGPLGITAGPDGNMWFAEAGGDRIGRITLAGVITEFPVPREATQPTFITAGGRGSHDLWFVTNGHVPHIGRISLTGTVTEFEIPGANSRTTFIGQLTGGRDGNVWMAQSEGLGGFIDRITPSGGVTQFKLADRTFGIALGPDGNIWFTTGPSNIGRITPIGTVTEFTVPDDGAGADQITSVPPSTLYFSIANAGQIGRINTNGKITIINIPGTASAIATGDGGTVWFINQNQGELVHFTPN